MSNVVMRRAEERNLPAIAGINSQVFLGDRDRVDGAKEWVEAWWRAFPLYQYFVVEVDGKTVGYAGWQLHGGFHRAEPVIELDQIGIDPAYQGQQLGPQLTKYSMREIAGWLKQKKPYREPYKFCCVGVCTQLQRYQRLRQRLYRRPVRFPYSIWQSGRKHAQSTVAHRNASA